MNDDSAYAKSCGIYDFVKMECVPLDQRVERGLMTQERYEDVVKINATTPREYDECLRIKRQAASR
ncbi:MAG: hypothetical protein LBS92_03690 [Candidatus Methanoplasma sp.]|jgi:hypothetical protein|nr:hypothetical protein [Candidatus Methanoplasma sp.]